MSKPIFILQSPCLTRSGYGDLSLAIAKSLLRYDKFDLRLVPTPWGACSRKNLDDELNDQEGKQLLNKILNGPLQSQPDVFMQITIPNEFMAPAKFNIGYTAGIETTVPKAEWLEGLNRMNLNIITSIHSRNVFEQASYMKKEADGRSAPLLVTKPMEVVFWGADTTKYYKTNEKIDSVEELFKDIPETFGFLFVGQWTAGNMAADRKAIGFLVKTFIESFKDTKNAPCLVLKTNGAQLSVMDKYDCISKINDITNMVKSQHSHAQFPNVYLLHGELSDKEMNALYNHSKIKVHMSFTHGEGYGHPILLATLSGKPVLAPNWSGHLDFLNPSYARFFDGKLVPIPGEAINDWFVKDAQWFDVNYELAGSKMRSYFYNYSGRILDDAETLRKENTNKFSLEAMDKTFHAILDQYVPKFATEQSIVLPKLKKLNLPKAYSSTEKQYYGQYKQDKFVNEHIFKDKSNGVFVDIGAYDGIHCSNTYFFEKHLKWTGICIEPHPEIFKKLKSNRNCISVEGCAWVENGIKPFKLITGESDMLSGLISAYDPAHLKRIANDATDVKDIEVNCFDVNELLVNNKLTKIDFLSLDTEGSELDILKHIKWDQISVNVIAVENQYDPNPIREYMKSVGYNLLTHIEIDDIFVKS